MWRSNIQTSQTNPVHLERSLARRKAIELSRTDDPTSHDASVKKPVMPIIRRSSGADLSESCAQECSATLRTLPLPNPHDARMLGSRTKHILSLNISIQPRVYRKPQEPAVSKTEQRSRRHRPVACNATLLTPLYHSPTPPHS